MSSGIEVRDREGEGLVARRFAVSPSAAIKLMQRVRATGSAAPARFGGHRRPLLAPHEGEFKRLVAAAPHLTLVELQRRCSSAAGCAPGCRRSTRLSTGSACGTKKALRAAEQDGPTSPPGTGAGAAGSAS
jgi:hypothetical protein